MSTFSLKPISVEDQDDLRADARAEMFFTLRNAFVKRQEECGIKAKDLGEILAKNKSYVSRVLNGTQESIDYETLYIFLHALGYHLELNPVSFDVLSSRKKNFDVKTSASSGTQRQPSLFFTRFKCKSSESRDANLMSSANAPRVRQITRNGSAY